MKYAFTFGKIEITGVAEVQDVNIQMEADIEESVTFVKQILPIVKEIKSFRMFETEKDNSTLSRNLNQVRDEKREMERENLKIKSSTDLQTMKLKDELNDKNEKISELEKKLEEAGAISSKIKPINL